MFENLFNLHINIEEICNLSTNFGKRKDQDTDIPKCCFHRMYARKISLILIVSFIQPVCDEVVDSYLFMVVFMISFSVLSYKKKHLSCRSVTLTCGDLQGQIATKKKQQTSVCLV